jgi:hypothetical protein
MPSPTGPFWFIIDGTKLIQCTKDDFDKAIVEGKSVKYKGYANKRIEKIADQLEASRISFLANPNLPVNFRAVLTKPSNVVQVQIIDVDDPEFWIKESKNPKYQH